MIQAIEGNNSVFLADFDRLDKQPGADCPPWVRRLRKGAIAHFAETGFPTTRQEEWRFTDVSAIATTPFEPAAPPPEPPTREQLDEAAPVSKAGRRVVLVNGRYWRESASVSSTSHGVTSASLAEALRTRRELVEPHLGRHAACQGHPFVALNTALLEDGAFIHVAPGTVVEEPIVVLHVWTAAGRPRVAHPRNLIVVGGRAEVRIVEIYAALAESADFTNAVTEIVLEPEAIVDHYKLQREGVDAFHMGTVQVLQRRASAFSSHLLSVGGALARNETNVRLDDEECHATLNGLYLARGRQLLDCRTRIDHAKPHCQSRELYRGILDGHARGVFNGKIIVHQDAQKTDAKQTNQTLLLSDDAKVNAKPQLEIFADDVKCTHGATVGRLDEEAVFYLRSRGISHQRARDLLIYAFANEAIGQARLPAIRAELEQILLVARGLPLENTP